jgi:glycosyltransferase involved in cell wall biosynthesis
MDDLVRIYAVAPARISIVHLGVDPDLKRVSDPAAIERVRQRYGISERYILYLGTLQPRKNLTRLIEAFAEISETAAWPCQLVLAGKRGWMHEPIVLRAQELALEKRVVFPGFVEDADLPALYSGADLFVMPSLYEGFCLPVLEAMACEVPVACSNLSSLPEVAGDAALSFDPRDVEGMAATIARGLGDAELRATLVARGRERVRQFTWERCAQKVLETLVQVAARGT